jgi:uncharacterized protein YciI
MRIYAALIRYIDNVVELRAPHRPKHLEYLENLHGQGKVLMAGAWADPVDGALFVYRADSREEVEQLIANDPYNRAGLFVEVTIREWNVVIGAIS